MQRRFLSGLLAFLLLAPLMAACADKGDPEAAADIRLYQVLPVARKQSKMVGTEGEGESIALINVGDKAHTISGWTVAAGTGKVVLPALTINPGSKVYLANDVEYFKKYWNFAPDFEYGSDTDKAVPDLRLPEKQAPVMNDLGDVVRLLDDKGKLVDILAYGAVGNPPTPWTGPAVEFVNSFPLTPGNQAITRMKEGDKFRTAPSAVSWSNGTLQEPQRVYYAGQSDFPVKVVSGQMTLTAASAPDNAGHLIIDLIDKARKNIRMVSYQFTNQDIADHLIAAVKRGVHVQVGVERNPGGSDMYDSDKEAHEKLHKGGVEVLYYHKWDGDLSSRVNPVHSKYATFDEETVVVTSGNWTGGSFPTYDPSCGNREWTLGVTGNADVVKLVKELWDYDFASGSVEVRPWNEKLDRPLAPDTYDPGPCFRYTAIKPSPLTVSAKGSITRIVSPDNTLDREKGFLGLLRNAKEELLISANYINRWWGAASDETNFTKYPQPYLTEIVAAARRGVAVKVLLDRRNVSLTSKRDNHYVVQYLTDLAVNEKLKLEARLVNMDGSGIGRTYHNKSLIVDGSVVISSINGSENSFRYARELALKVDGVPEITNYYRDLFLADWKASDVPNKPWEVQIIPQTKGAFVNWSPNAELDVVKYEVYYRAKSDAQWQKVTEVERPGFTDNRTTGIWGVVAVTRAGTRSNYAEADYYGTPAP